MQKHLLLLIIIASGSLFCPMVLPNTSVQAATIPGDVGEYTDTRCGRVHLPENTESPRGCKSQTDLEGDRLPDTLISSPDGSQTSTPNPLVNYDPLDLIDGEEIDIPTGRGDLGQWLGHTSTGEPITLEMPCAEIYEKVFSVASPGETHTGIWARLKTPDEFVPENWEVYCEEIKQWYNEKSQGEVVIEAQLPMEEDPTQVGACLLNRANIALPTWGPMQAANRIWRWLRPPYYQQSENYALQQQQIYRQRQAGQENLITQKNNYFASAQVLSQSVTLAQSANPPDNEPVLAPGSAVVTSPTTTAFFNPGSCVGGNCDTVENDDSALCYLEEDAHQVNVFMRTLEIGQVPMQEEEYLVDLTTADPALGGGHLYTEEETGERVFDLTVAANYLYFPFTAGPMELLNQLWNTERFGQGEGEDWEYENLTNAGSKWWGLGHTTALQASACRATTTPDILAANPEYCGPLVESMSGTGATSPYTEGEEFQEPATIEESGTNLEATDYSEVTTNPDCSVCELNPNRSYTIPDGLVEVLNQAGSAFNVPADVLLGILLHEGWHPSGPHVLNFTETQVSQAVSSGDPYCVRNSFCAAGPFQFLTNPSSFGGTIKELSNGCPNWPGPGYDVWSTYTGTPGSTKRANFNTLLGASPDYNPHPCKLRDAAFAAAAHVKGRVNASDNCAAWGYGEFREAWRTYYGSCEDNYCDGNFAFLEEVCLD